MAYEESLVCVTLESSGDLSDYQYRLVKVATDGQVELCSAAAQAVGVLQNKPGDEGQAASVAVAGITKLVAASGVSAGDVLESAANGVATTLSSGKALAVALEDAPDASGIISAVLII